MGGIMEAVKSRIVRVFTETYEYHLSGSPSVNTINSPGFQKMLAANAEAIPEILDKKFSTFYASLPFASCLPQHVRHKDSFLQKEVRTCLSAGMQTKTEPAKHAEDQVRQRSSETQRHPSTCDRGNFATRFADILQCPPSKRHLLITIHNLRVSKRRRKT